MPTLSPSSRAWVSIPIAVSMPPPRRHKTRRARGASTRNTTILMTLSFTSVSSGSTMLSTSCSFSCVRPSRYRRAISPCLSRATPTRLKRPLSARTNHDDAHPGRSARRPSSRLAGYSAKQSHGALALAPWTPRWRHRHLTPENSNSQEQVSDVRNHPNHLGQTPGRYGALGAELAEWLEDVAVGGIGSLVALSHWWLSRRAGGGQLSCSSSPRWPPRRKARSHWWHKSAGMLVRGSQMGSQRPQILGGSQPQSARVCPARRPAGRRAAAPGDRLEVPPKQ